MGLRLIQKQERIAQLYFKVYASVETSDVRQPKMDEKDMVWPLSSTYIVMGGSAMVVRAAVIWGFGRYSIRATGQ